MSGLRLRRLRLSRSRAARAAGRWFTGLNRRDR
jgi:hypothetical protein